MLKQTRFQLNDAEVKIWEKYPSAIRTSNTTTNFLIPLIILFTVLIFGSIKLYLDDSKLFVLIILFAIIDIALIAAYFKSRSNPYLKEEQYILTNQRLVQIRSGRMENEKLLCAIKTIELDPEKKGLNNIIIDKEIRWANKTARYMSMESYKNEYSKETFVLWHMEQAEDIVKDIQEAKKSK